MGWQIENGVDDGIRDRIASGSVRPSHAVQLFDEPVSLWESLSRFILSGLEHDGVVLLFITPAHWTAVRQCAPQPEIDAALADGRVTVEDASAALTALMTDGWPDPEKFETLVSRRVKHLLSSPRKLSIYGDIVDLLASRGEMRCAERLEELWNALQAEHDFRLFCGYSAASFGNPRHGDALRTICAAHDAVHCRPGDVLSEFLLKALHGPRLLA